jgi:hypothetical protein
MIAVGASARSIDRLSERTGDFFYNSLPSISRMNTPFCWPHVRTRVDVPDAWVACHLDNIGFSAFQ